MGTAAVLCSVRGHGGGIRVETGPGHGTAVTVLFPPAAAPKRRTPSGAAHEIRGRPRLTSVHHVGRHACCKGLQRAYHREVSVARRRGTSSGRHPPMKTRNLMSEAVPTCGPRDALLDAARVMLRS